MNNSVSAVSIEIDEFIEDKLSSREDRINRRASRLKLLRWCSLIGVFVIWQLFGMLNKKYAFFNPVFLPSPTDVLKVGYSMIQDGTLIKHILASFIRIVLGFGIGTIVAIILGILITRSEVLENIIDPVLSLIGPIPPFAFLPLFIIWFGVGEFPKITLIAYATFLPILTYTIDGLKSINPVLIRSALSLGASEFRVFTKVILKSALPNIFVGMRVSLALTFSALVVAEMMGADKGLGYIIVDARNWFKTDNMFLAAALIGIEYSIFDFALRLICKYLFKWKKGGMKDAVEN
ncbi:MAG TPA: ABC transporter permease [Clostridia bacterium]|nr:ABC transporter permease [Clostridia bacterium]